jgi:hypothetical protein
MAAPGAVAMAYREERRRRPRILWAARAYVAGRSQPANGYVIEAADLCRPRKRGGLLAAPFDFQALDGPWLCRAGHHHVRMRTGFAEFALETINRLQRVVFLALVYVAFAAIEILLNGLCDEIFKHGVYNLLSLLDSALPPPSTIRVLVRSHEEWF